MELARQEWVKASGGLVWTPQDLLERLQGEIAKVSEPWILLDLDHTLLETVIRTHRILMEAVEAVPLPGPIAETLKAITPDRMGFSLEDTFNHYKVVLSEEQTAQIREFWWDRFFGEDYLHHDMPYPGAVEFTHALYRSGAHLCYLTARAEARMGKGTRATLERLGFPWDEGRTSLHMKKDEDGSDHGHKASVAEIVPPTAEVVASFENEPRNVVELAATFPNALQIFVDSKCSKSPARPYPGLLVLKQFR